MLIPLSSPKAEVKNYTKARTAVVFVTPHHSNMMQSVTWHHHTLQIAVSLPVLSTTMSTGTATVQSNVISHVISLFCIFTLAFLQRAQSGTYFILTATL